MGNFKKDGRKAVIKDGKKVPTEDSKGTSKAD